MKEVSRQTPPQESTSSLAVPFGRDTLAETMLEFLLWMEESKGLRLCQAFKPQHDWYMPALADVERLAREFLGMKAATGPDKPNMEHLT